MLCQRSLRPFAFPKSQVVKVGMSPVAFLQRRTIFPPPPQHIEGTVNDAVKIPPVQKTHGSYHWTTERLIATAIVPLTVAPFATGASFHPVTDAIFGALLVFHTHIGFDSCVKDYFPAREFPKIGPMMNWILRFATGLTLIGLYEFNTNDVGITELVRRIWTANRQLA